MRRKLVTARQAAFAGFALALSAQAASPTLSHIVPGGGQRGTEVEVVCEGGRLDDAKGLLFYSRGLSSLYAIIKYNFYNTNIPV